jgi:hypothetical protein
MDNGRGVVLRRSGYGLDQTTPSTGDLSELAGLRGGIFDVGSNFFVPRYVKL